MRASRALLHGSLWLCVSSLLEHAQNRSYSPSHSLPSLETGGVLVASRLRQAIGPPSGATAAIRHPPVVHDASEIAVPRTAFQKVFSLMFLSFPSTAANTPVLPNVQPKKQLSQQLRLLSDHRINHLRARNPQTSPARRLPCFRTCVVASIASALLAVRAAAATSVGDIAVEIGSEHLRGD